MLRWEVEWGAFRIRMLHLQSEWSELQDRTLHWEVEWRLVYWKAMVKFWGRMQLDWKLVYIWGRKLCTETSYFLICHKLRSAAHTILYFTHGI